jgi:ATP-dependent RNA helicase DeaD
VGRERKADPKWLLPEICRQGELTKKDIGAIKVFDTETLFQIDAKVAEKFTAMVSERKKGGVRIMPAQDQTGISRARQSTPEGAAENTAAAPEVEPRKEGGFHQRKFGGEKFGEKKSGDKKKFGGKKFDSKRFDKKKPGGYPPKRQKPPGA